MAKKTEKPKPAVAKSYRIPPPGPAKPGADPPVSARQYLLRKGVRERHHGAMILFAQKRGGGARTAAEWDVLFESY